MKARLATAAVGAALALASVATGAHAQKAQLTSKPNDATAAASAADAFGDTGTSITLHPATPRKSLQWDSKGRWGVKLDYQQPAIHDDQWQSIDAGPYCKLTPRLHIGGTVGLSGQPDPRTPTPGPQQAQPRVRLETTFKF
jgi:hypothetical protein